MKNTQPDNSLWESMKKKVFLNGISFEQETKISENQTKDLISKASDGFRKKVYPGVGKISAVLFGGRGKRKS